MSEAKKFSLHQFDDSSLSLDEILFKVIINHLEIDNPELFNQLIKIKSEPERIVELKKVIDIGSFSETFDCTIMLSSKLRDFPKITDKVHTLRLGTIVFEGTPSISSRGIRKNNCQKCVKSV